MATYSYDGLGRRITKSVYNSAGTAVLTTTDDYYDESGQVVEEQTHSGVGALVSTTQYVWDVSYVDSPVLRFQTPVGGSTQTLYYMWDANHNITGLVDPTTGKVVERYVYDPYGKVTVCHGNDGGSAADWTPLVSGGSSSAASPSVYSAYGNEVMFAGYMYDAETAVVYGGSLIAAGNYHADNREFITSISTWDIQDPMGYAAGDANLYRYCGDQPTIATDPSGLWEHVRNDQWKSNKDDETFMDLAEIILRIWPGITSRFHSVWGMTR
jgi:RHS repeat-associated protein